MHRAKVAREKENSMSYANSQRFSIAGFALACAITLAINGSLLLGFDHLAQSADATAANTVSPLAGTALRDGSVTPA